MINWIKNIWCKIFRCKSEKKGLVPVIINPPKPPKKNDIIFNKDIEINTSFNYDNVTIEKENVLIKGKYSVDFDNGLKPIKEVNIKKLTIEDGAVLKIQSIDTIINIDEIVLHSGKLIITTEAKDFENGTTLKIGSIKVNYSNNFSNMFLQNIKGGSIDKFHVNKTGFNKDGSDSDFGKYGIMILKWDNALAPLNDKRKFHIKETLIENSNMRLFKKINMKAFWLDEGTNNITFDSFISDLPIQITPKNEYNPLSTGNHQFKYLELKNKKAFLMNYLVNSKVDVLKLDDTYANIQNCIVGKLIADDTQITIDKETIIKAKKLNGNSKITIK